MARKNNKPITAQMPPDEPDLKGIDTNFKTVNADELDKKATRQIADFTDLLDSISSIEDKTKSLWRNIFENAVQDRRNAYLMWADLYLFVHHNPTEHAIHGQNLSRYMERMSKANDQILKLAEMVAAEGKKEVETTITQDDIYHQIQQVNNGYLTKQ